MANRKLLAGLLLSSLLTDDQVGQPQSSSAFFAISINYTLKATYATPYSEDAVKNCHLGLENNNKCVLKW